MTDWNVDLPKLVKSKIYAVDDQVLKEFLNIVLCEIVRRKIEEPTKEFWDIVNKETDKIFKSAQRCFDSPSLKPLFNKKVK